MAADRDGVVVVSRYGEVVALDREGAQHWRIRLERASVFNEVALGPSVVVVAGASLEAVDRTSGQRLWVLARPEVNATAVDDGAVAALLADGELDVVDAHTGAARWTARIPVVGNLMRPRLWVGSNRVVATWGDTHTGSHVRVYDESTGVVVWSDDALHFSSAPVVSDDGFMTFAVNDRQDRRKRVVSRVRRLAIVDGSERWSTELRGRQSYWAEIDAAADRESVAVVDLDGRVTLLDASTGRVRWRRSTGRRQFSARPLIIGRAFVLPTYGTGLTALGVARGDEVHNDEPGVVQTAVTIEAAAVADGRLYLLAASGRGAGSVWMLRPGRD
jgi:outer membrane protein assembly factor BamB